MSGRGSSALEKGAAATRNAEPNLPWLLWTEKRAVKRLVLLTGSNQTTMG